MEMEEGSTQTGSDSASASASGSCSSPFSSQGSVPSRGKELRSSNSSKDKCSESTSTSRSRDSHRRRGKENSSKSLRRGSRSRTRSSDSCSRHGSRRTKTSPIHIVFRSPRGARRHRKYRRENRRRSKDHRRSRSRSSSRRRRGRSRSRSSSSRRARHGRSTERGRSRSSLRSAFTIRRRSRRNNFLRSKMEAILRKHCKEIPLYPSMSTADNSSSQGENLTKRFRTRVIFVTNLAPEVTKGQVEGLFGNFGRIRQVDLYKITSLQSTMEMGTSEAKVSAFVKFKKADSTNVAVHLIGFPFLERPLLVFPCTELDKLPESEKARKLFSLGMDKVIQLIKDNRLNQILNDEVEDLKASSESPDPQILITSSESHKDIQMLLTWQNDWLNYFVTKHKTLATKFN